MTVDAQQLVDALEVVKPGEATYRVTEHHTHLARLVVCFGMGPAEIAEEEGFDVSYVRKLLRSQPVLAEIERVAEEEKVNASAYRAMAAANVVDAVQTAVAIMRDEGEDGKVRLEACKFIADRGGLPKETRTETVSKRLSLTGEDLDRIRRNALEAQREGRAIECVITSEGGL